MANVKYEEVYLNAYDSVSHARSSLGRYFDFYNTRRTHTSLEKRTPDEVYFNLQPLKKLLNPTQRIHLRNQICCSNKRGQLSCRGDQCRIVGRKYLAVRGGFKCVEDRGFSPGTGIAGAVVTLNGKNFDSSTASANRGSLNGVSATVTAATATSLTFVVPVVRHQWADFDHGRGANVYYFQ